MWLSNVIEQIDQLVNCVCATCKHSTRSVVKKLKQELAIYSSLQENSTILKTKEVATKFTFLGDNSAIAYGKHSRVHLWQRKSNGNIFAVKFYSGGVTAKHRLEVKWIRNEVEFLMTHFMAHPHPFVLHHVEKFNNEDNGFCVILEDCSAGKLQHFLKNKKGGHFLFHQASDWMTQILSVEKHLQRLENENLLCCDFGVEDIYLSWYCEFQRVKVRLHPILSVHCDPAIISTVRGVRRATVLYILSQLFEGAPADLQRQLKGLPALLAEASTSVEDVMRMDYFKESLSSNSVIDARIHLNSKLKDYERIVLIGQGSFGHVWKMWNKVKKENYAVKIPIGWDDWTDESITNEIRHLRSLKHPKIVRFEEDFINKNGILFIVMEFCDGGNLAQRLELQAAAGPFTRVQVRHFFLQLLEGLQFLHSENVFHGDIKPQNILLSTKDNVHHVKLGDFGTARLMSSQSSYLTATHRFGTFLYMAPEILLFNSDASDTLKIRRSADIWSLGCVLYEIVALSPAFAPDDDELPERVRRGRFSPFPEHWDSSFADKYKDAIEGMLTVNPKNRIGLNDMKILEWFGGDDLNEEEWIYKLEESVDISSRVIAPLMPVKYIANSSLWIWAGCSATVRNSWKSIVTEKYSKEILSAILWKYDDSVQIRLRRDSGELFFECKLTKSMKCDLVISLFVRWKDCGNHSLLEREFRTVLYESHWTELRFGLVDWNAIDRNYPPRVHVSCCNESYFFEIQGHENCASVIGATKKDIEDWSEMCRVMDGPYWLCLSLPLIQMKGDLKNIPIQFSLRRFHDFLYMTYKMLSTCPDCIHVKMSIRIVISHRDGTQETVHREELVQLCFSIPVLTHRVSDWSTVHPRIPPQVILNVSPANTKLSAFHWLGRPPLFLSASNESGVFTLLDANTVDIATQNYWEMWRLKHLVYFWFPSVKVQCNNLHEIVVLINIDHNNFHLRYHPDMNPIFECFVNLQFSITNTATNEKIVDLHQKQCQVGHKPLVIEVNRKKYPPISSVCVVLSISIA